MYLSPFLNVQETLEVPSYRLGTMPSSGGSQKFLGSTGRSNDYPSCDTEDIEAALGSIHRISVDQASSSNGKETYAAGSH